MIDAFPFRRHRPEQLARLCVIEDLMGFENVEVLPKWEVAAFDIRPKLGPWYSPALR
jgi:hypothetical protein